VSEPFDKALSNVIPKSFSESLRLKEISEHLDDPSYSLVERNRNCEELLSLIDKGKLEFPLHALSYYPDKIAANWSYPSKTHKVAQALLISSHNKFILSWQATFDALATYLHPSLILAPWEVATTDALQNVYSKGIHFLSSQQLDSWIEAAIKNDLRSKLKTYLWPHNNTYPLSVALGVPIAELTEAKEQELLILLVPRQPESMFAIQERLETVKSLFADQKEPMAPFSIA
jgi:hypothetical protein